MNRRGLLSLALFAGLTAGLCFALGVSRASADGGTFPAPGGGTITVYGLRSDLFDSSARMQEMDQWCWAACIEMLMHRYGYVVDQPAIVATVFQGVVNRPGQVPDILRLLNHSWTDRNGRYFEARSTVFNVSLTDAISDLAADRPLIIGTHGHAMVLTSITVANNPDGTMTMISATVRDPAVDPTLAPTRGKRILYPQEWNTMGFLARISIAP